MDDLKFDELMQRAGATASVGSAMVLQVAEESRGRVAASRRRRPLVIGAAIGATVLLAAATSTAALMGVPPFQGLEPDMYRTQHSIAIDYLSLTGHENHCRAFLEFTHLTVDQAAAADALVRQHDWAGIGQRAYDAAATSGTGGTGADAIETRFTDNLDRQLHAAAMQALPGIASSGISADGKAAWNGWSMSCKGGQH